MKFFSLKRKKDETPVKVLVVRLGYSPHGFILPKWHLSSPHLKTLKPRKKDDVNGKRVVVIKCKLDAFIPAMVNASTGALFKKPPSPWRRTLGCFCLG